MDKYKDSQDFLWTVNYFKCVNTLTFSFENLDDVLATFVARMLNFFCLNAESRKQ